MGEVIYGRFPPTGRMGPAHRTHPANRLIREIRADNGSRFIKIKRMGNRVYYEDDATLSSYEISYETYVRAWVKALGQKDVFLAYNFQITDDSLKGEVLRPSFYHKCSKITQSLNWGMSNTPVNELLEAIRKSGYLLYGKKFLGFTVSSDTTIELFHTE